MSQKSSVKKKTNKVKKPAAGGYISNPFRLAFKGMSNWLTYNQTLSVLVIATSFGAVLFNMFGPADSKTIITMPDNLHGAALLLSFVIIFALLAASVIFNTLYMGMVAFVGLQTLKKRTVAFSSALQVARQKFWNILLAQLLISLKIIGGLFLLIIPGIRAALRYSIVHFYIVDKNYDALTAMKKSKELTKDHLIEIFGLYFASGIVPVVNGLLLVGGQTEMYAQLSRLKSSKKPKPKVHWLNYLGPLVIFIVMLFLMAILILVIVALAQLTKTP